MILDRRTLERIARTAHEVNRAYCRQLGEEAQPEWSLITGLERQRVRDAARGVLDGTFVSIEDQHDAWVSCRREDGWQYGPKKSLADKRSPALVPYAQLPVEQRLKGAIFRAVCVETQHLLMEPPP